jgi:phosphatidylglycerophosphate synthase
VFKKELRQIGTGFAAPVVSILNGRIHPNVLTVSGTVLSIASSVVIVSGHFLSGAIVLAVGSFCDLLDGELARVSKKETAFGAFFDAVLDRISDGAPLAALIVYFAWHHMVVGAGAACIAVIVSATIPYTKAALEVRGHTNEVGVLPRAPRLILVIAGVAFGQHIAVWGLCLVAVLGSVTVVQRIRQASCALARVQRSSS